MGYAERQFKTRAPFVLADISPMNGGTLPRTLNPPNPSSDDNLPLTLNRRGLWDAYCPTPIVAWYL